MISKEENQTTARVDFVNRKDQVESQEGADF